MSSIVQWLSSSEQYLRDLGWAGVFLYVGIIVLVQVFMAPLSPFAIACGFIFGLSRGIVAVELGTTLGAALNFLMARYVARGAFSRRLAQNEKFRLIDEAIGREGWKIVALLRFCPIPFGLANYAYGLTAIPFWPYLGATVVAIASGNIFFVWFGATAHAGLQAALGAGRARHPMEYALLGVGLLAALCALVYVTKIARAALARSGHAALVDEAA